jgi:hypothetical protein
LLVTLLIIVRLLVFDSHRGSEEEVDLVHRAANTNPKLLDPILVAIALRESNSETIETVSGNGNDGVRVGTTVCVADRYLACPSVISLEVFTGESSLLITSRWDDNPHGVLSREATSVDHSIVVWTNEGAQLHLVEEARRVMVRGEEQRACTGDG